MHLRLFSAGGDAHFPVCWRGGSILSYEYFSLICGRVAVCVSSVLQEHLPRFIDSTNKNLSPVSYNRTTKRHWRAAHQPSWINPDVSRKHVFPPLFQRMYLSAICLFCSWRDLLITHLSQYFLLPCSSREDVAHF